MRASLVRYLGGETGEDDVFAALEVLAREAQARRLNAEHMLIAFKAIWPELAEQCAIGDALDRKEMLDHLVTCCIDAYYQRGT